MLAVVVAFAVAIKAWRTSTLVGFLGLGALVAQDLVLSLLPPGSALYRLVLGDASSQQSDANRVDVLYTTFNSFLEKPFFGRGFANSLEAHNIYLQVATAAGLFGLLGFALILFTAIRPIFMPQLGSLRWLALPPVAYLVAGLVANTLWDRFVWVLVGLAVLSLPRPGGRPGVDPSAALPEPAAATARS